MDYLEEFSTFPTNMIFFHNLPPFMKVVPRRQVEPPLEFFSESIPSNVTIGCLTWLSEKTGRRNVFEVWDAAYLLMELRAGIGNPLPSYAVASDLLNKTSFNYHPSTRCQFHEEKDIHFCALAYSKRLCYLMSDAVCNLFNIQLTEKHIPTRAMEEKLYTVMVLQETAHSEVSPVRLDRPHNFYQNTRRIEEGINEDSDNSAEASKDSIESRKHVPRQPASSSVAEEMTRLQLNITAATLPGHGIGRGFRRQ